MGNDSRGTVPCGSPYVDRRQGAGGARLYEVVDEELVGPKVAVRQRSEFRRQAFTIVHGGKAAEEILLDAGELSILRLIMMTGATSQEIADILHLSIVGDPCTGVGLLFIAGGRSVHAAAHTP